MGSPRSPSRPGATPPLAGRAGREEDKWRDLASTAFLASSPSSPLASLAGDGLGDEGVGVGQAATASASGPVGLALAVGGGPRYSVVAGTPRGGAHGLKLLLPIRHMAAGAVGGRRVDIGPEEIRIGDTGRSLTPAEDLVLCRNKLLYSGDGDLGIREPANHPNEWPLEVVRYGWLSPEDSGGLHERVVDNARIYDSGVEVGSLTHYAA